MMLAAGAAQRWTWTNDMQVSPTESPGVCLASCGVVGCNVPLAACTSNDTQRWLYDDRDRLVPLSHPLLCLSFWGANTVVKLDTCSLSTPQQRDVISGVWGSVWAQPSNARHVDDAHGMVAVHARLQQKSRCTSWHVGMDLQGFTGS
jgi:hypothetical protein